MHITPWTSKHHASSSSSLTSDRIRTPNRSNTSSPNPSKSKGKSKTPDIPKSKEVKRLEHLIEGLKASIDGKKPPGKAEACFCQARNHILSSHTPLCTSCGLILCTLQPPYFPCPHCSSPLLTPSQQLSHLSSLALQLSETLEREEQQRVQAIEDAKKAAGAFPVLGATIAGAGGNGGGGGGFREEREGPHKVLSLNSKTKKVTLSSYHTPQPTLSPHLLIKSSAPEVEDVVTDRVPPPSAEVPFFETKGGAGGRNDAQRWADLSGSGETQAVYVDLPREKARASEGSRRRRKGRGDGGHGNAHTVPGASQS